jgi:tetratricopeptide (TPR) repeat protein
MGTVLQTHGYGQLGLQRESGSNDACISGDIAFTGDASSLTVDLRSFGPTTELPQSVPVTGLGRFDLGCVKEGAYQIRIRNGAGFVVQEELVTARLGLNQVTVYLAEKRTTPSNAHSVSINELHKKVNGKAASELRKAQERRRRDEIQLARTHVMKALEKDPYFVDAHIEAGLIHAVMNDHVQAAVAFRKAAELDPASVRAHNNLAIELLKLKQFSGAEQAARRALQLDHTRRSMEYALGASLAFQRRNPDDALKYLRRAAAEYPRARLVAANVLLETGQTSEAIGEVKLFLTSNVEAAERAQIEEWLARVR